MSLLLQGTDLTKRFVIKRGLTPRSVQYETAVNSVSIDIEKARTIAVVGESGAGKSTLARLLMRLVEADSGTVTFDGVDLSTLGRNQLRILRRRIQMIFQDPFSSLDPRKTVGSAVEEALLVHFDMSRSDRASRVAELFADVGMNKRHMERYPHEFSGGQLQRVAIARALAVQPDVLVCDEPVAALDVSIRAQIVNLLGRLQAENGFAILFVSHDMALVRYIADDVVVMKSGEVVERGTASKVFETPQADYTKALLGAIPIPDPRVRRIVGHNTAGAGTRYGGGA